MQYFGSTPRATVWPEGGNKYLNKLFLTWLHLWGKWISELFITNIVSQHCKHVTPTSHCSVGADVSPHGFRCNLSPVQPHSHSSSQRSHNYLAAKWSGTDQHVRYPEHPQNVLYFTSELMKWAFEDEWLTQQYETLQLWTFSLSTDQKCSHAIMRRHSLQLYLKRRMILDLWEFIIQW